MYTTNWPLECWPSELKLIYMGSVFFISLIHLLTLLFVCGRGVFCFVWKLTSPHTLCNSCFQLPVLFLGLQKYTTRPNLKGFLPLFDLHACDYPLQGIFPVLFYFVLFLETFTFLEDLSWLSLEFLKSVCLHFQFPKGENIFVLKFPILDNFSFLLLAAF